MSYQLNPMPEPEVSNWETASLEDVRAEVKSLRHFVGSLFMQIKEWTGRMNDLAAASEQILKLKGDDESKYIALSNKTANLDAGLEIAHNTLNELNENITLIMDFLGMSGDTEGDNNQ